MQTFFCAIFSDEFAFVVIVLIQVLGGGVSIVVGSYVWSTSSFDILSACISGVSNVSDLLLVFDTCSFVDCSAMTSAVQGEESCSRSWFR